MRLVDLTGQKFGYLTVIRRDGSVIYRNGKKGNAKWLCRCECGAERSICGSKLRRGEHQSCGCKKSELIIASLTTHNMTGTSTYRIWANMVKRCLNSKHPRYYRYGGRGISICKRWRKFENFLADMGERPQNLTIDRIDNDGDYCPENCRWATPLQQSNNKGNNRIFKTSRGDLTLAQLSRIAGVTPGAIRDRFLRGLRGDELFVRATPGRKPCTTS